MSAKLEIQLISAYSKVPSRAYSCDIGYDLYCVGDISFVNYNGLPDSTDCYYLLGSGETRYFGTGLLIKPPDGYWCQLETRSGMGGDGILVMGGICDPGYRGEYRVALCNTGLSPYMVRHGSKIAQMVLRSVILAEIELVEGLDISDRGIHGFGSSD